MISSQRWGDMFDGIVAGDPLGFFIARIVITRLTMTPEKEVNAP